MSESHWMVGSLGLKMYFIRLVIQGEGFLNLTPGSKGRFHFWALASAPTKRGSQSECFRAK